MKKKITDKIIIGYSKLRISLPILMAIKYKYFEEEGFENIEFRGYETAESMMHDLSLKKLHMGGYCALPIAFNAIEKSKTELLFLTSLHEDNNRPISFILMKKDNNKIKNIQDLRGKKIGILPTDAYETWIKHILDINDIEINDVDIIKVSPEIQAEELKKGEIDILLTADPMASNIISSEIGIQIFPKKASITEVTRFDPFYFGSFNVRKEYEDSNFDNVLKIALVLNKIILEINNGKSSEKIRESLSLLENYRDTGENISKGYYKTTNEYLEYDLKDMEQYYYHRGLLSSPVSIEDMQYKYKNKSFGKWIYNASSFINKHQTIATIIASATIGLVTYVSTNYYNDLKYNEDLERQRKTVPAEFILRYIETDVGEKPRLTNIGKSKLINLEIEMELYFITEKDVIYQADNMEQLCELDEELFKKIVDNSNLVKNKSDFEGLFGDVDRKFTSEYLNPYRIGDEEMVTIDNSIDMDFSTSAIRQALDISKALDSQLFLRWKIKYNEEYSAKQKIVYFYIWVNQNADNIDDKYKNLKDVIGGKRLIEIIQDYENNSKYTIFK